MGQLFINPQQPFYDDRGRPLKNGRLVFGELNKDPLNFPRDVTNRDGESIGNIVTLSASGTQPVDIFLPDREYSLRIEGRRGYYVQVYDTLEGAQLFTDDIQTIVDSASAFASAANFKGRWSDATGAATVPSSYEHNGRIWLLLNDLADITAEEPSSSNTNYIPAQGYFESFSQLGAVGAGQSLFTTGYYSAGDGGADEYTSYNPTDGVPGYGVSAQTMLDAGCAGVKQSGSFIIVRNYNSKIDVRQMGFRPCSVTFVSDRVGHIPEAGAFDNAATFQKYDALVNFMSGHETTFSGHFAVGFTGYSTVRGANNTCCRYSARNGVLIGTAVPALILLPNQDAIVIRTPVNADPDYTDKIDVLELRNFVVSGNWSQQTWAGPTGLEALADNPQSGWVSGRQVYDQNGFSTINIKRLITNNSGVLNCAQDGMPSGSVDYFHHTNLICRWTGKGNNSNFTLGNGIYDNPLHEYANESPSDDKVVYTLSGDGYAGVGCQNIDEATEGAGNLVIRKPKGKQVNGRNALFAVIQGTVNPDVRIEYPDWSVTRRNSFTTSYIDGGGGSFRLVGGELSKNGNGRLGSIVNTPRVYILDKPVGTITNSNDGRINVENADYLEVEYEESGAVATGVTADGCDDVYVYNTKTRAVGFIGCDTARVRDSDIESPLRTESNAVTNFFYWNNSGGAHPEKRPNELISNTVVNATTIAAGAVFDVTITVTGASTGDFVDATSAASSSAEQLLISTARVTASDTVVLRLYNPTGSSVAIGSNLWSVVVRKRNVVI